MSVAFVIRYRYRLFKIKDPLTGWEKHKGESQVNTHTYVAEDKDD